MEATFSIISIEDEDGKRRIAKLLQVAGLA